VPLTVIAQQPTSTSLSLSPSTVVFGHEDSELIQVQVNGDTGNPAQGTATVLAGSTPLSQCTSMSLFSGGNNCTLNTGELQPGTYQLTARFNGSQNFAGSTSAPQTLTVVPQQPTTTSVTLRAASVPFGGEQNQTITVHVAPAVSGTPTGTVTVTAGSLTRIIALANGTGSYTLTASQLPPGSYPITATYSGDDTYATSTDTTQTLTVTKEGTTTNLTLSTDTIVVGGELAEVFTATVIPGVSGTPTGNIAVKAGAVGVCTITLAPNTNTGTCSPTSNNQLRRGTYQVTATYNGDATYAASTSTPPQPLTVTRR
jgi:hypothetical protein